MNRYILIFVALFVGITAQAQNSGPEMADQFRADGKIWVVISVIALVFLALVGFLVALERRLGRIEKQVQNKGN